MDINELRKIISELPKYPGTRNIPPASVCNDGFPGTFNLSYSEAEMIAMFGQYLDYDKDFVYSKIQPVIRFQDWSYVSDADEHSYRYLSVFDLADVGGAIILKNTNDLDDAVEFLIDQFAVFLFDKLGLDKSKIRISYFAGGAVKDVSNGKYDFNRELPADDKINVWKSHGILDNQFVPDKTRDTLLALNIFGLPTPWGFRHEINYLHQGKLLDIGTFEYLCYRPIFENEKVVDLKRWEHLFVISAVGLERILMIKNNSERITECEHIEPLIESILDRAKNKELSQAEILCQALRVIHRIINDCGTYEDLSPRRKEKIRTFYKAAILCHEKLGIELSEKQLKRWFKLNAKLQKFYPELKKSAKRASVELVEANIRFNSDKSKKGV